MSNHKIAKVAGVTVAAAAAVAFTAASASAAAPAHRIVAGTTKSGTVAFTGTTTASGVVFKDGNITMKCTKSTASGTVKLGAAVAPARTATIAKSTWSGCTGPAALKLVVVQKTAWYINTNGATRSGVTPVFINNVTAYVHAPTASQCNFFVTGSVAGNYANGTRQLNVNGGASGAHLLSISKVHGCFGLIKNGQHPGFTAHYKVTTPKGALRIS